MAKDNQHDVEYEKNLIRRYQEHGDKRALGELHARFGGLLNNIVDRYRSSGVPISALRNEAQERLDEYAGSYDLSRQIKPSTWFQSNIQKKMMRFTTSYHSGRLPESHSFLIPRVKSAEQELKDEGFSFPTDQQVADRANLYKKRDGEATKPITAADVRRIREAPLGDLPGSTVVGDYGDNSGVTLMDTVSESQDPSEVIEENAAKQHALMLVNKLPAPYREMILHNYGLGGFPQLSLRNLALKFGKNKYQIEKDLKEAHDMLGRIERGSGL